MSTLKSIVLTIRYLYLLLTLREQVIIGAWCELKWGDDTKSDKKHYISFSDEPDYDSEMDSYGFPDDSVYAYITKKDFLKRLWSCHEIYDYQIIGFTLNISDLLE